MRSKIPRGYGSLDWFLREYGSVSDDPWGLTWRPSQALRYQKVLSILENIPHSISSAVDVGCATGDFTHLLSRRFPGLEVLLGVDFVQSAVDRAQRRFPKIRFAKESVFSLGDKYEGQFDLVACLEMLYYLEERERAKALLSLRRTLRNGGYAVFSSFISESPHFSPQRLLDLVGSEFHVVASEVLHLRFVSVIETVATRLEKSVATLSRGRLNGSVTRTFGRLPLSTVSALETWSRVFRGFSASHTIVLARAHG
jgi:SAM-dependent methyltransferase